MPKSNSCNFIFVKMNLLLYQIEFYKSNQIVKKSNKEVPIFTIVFKLVLFATKITQVIYFDFKLYSHVLI